MNIHIAALNEYLANSAQRTEAAQWVTSDHVTGLLDKWRKERFENRECQCGNIVHENDVDMCMGFDEFVCKGRM